MKFKHLFMLPVLAVAFSIACNNGDKPPSTATAKTKAPTTASSNMDAGTTKPAPATAASTNAGISDPLKGTVKETMDAGGYSYVLLATGSDEVWAAARRFPVKVGDEVEIAGLMPMANFKSPSLDRSFDVIQFVSSARVIGGSQPENAAPAHGGMAPQSPVPAHSRTQSPTTASAEGTIEKLDDGMTVADLFAKSATLNGKTVKFKGRVVKANKGILNRNWLHIQDGTGTSGTNDITVTSADGYAAVGSVVTIEGTLALSRDFGAGYTYDVIVENATVTITP